MRVVTRVEKPKPEHVSICTSFLAYLLLPLMINVPKFDIPPLGMLPTTPKVKKRYSLMSVKASLT